MAGILIGNLTGFGREIVTAALLGATRAADLYLIAFAVPELLNILLLTIVAPALVPALVGRERRPPPAPQFWGEPEVGSSDPGVRPPPAPQLWGEPEMAGNVGAGPVSAAKAPPPETRIAAQTPPPALGGAGGGPSSPAAYLTFALAAWLGVGVAVGAAALAIAAPIWVPAIGPGLTPGEVERVAGLARVMLIGAGVLGWSAVAIAALIARRRFAGPALAAAIYNAVFVAVAWIGFDRAGLAAFGPAVAAGMILTLVGLLFFVRRSGIGLRPALRDPGVRRAFRLAGPVAAGYFIHHFAFLADRAIGSGLPDGELAALNYAFRLALVIEQAVGIAVATVALPALAEQVAAGRVAAVRSTLGSALRLVAALAWPAIGFLVIFADPIVRLLFERGAFDARAAGLTTAALAVFAIGILADTVVQPIWRYFYAVEAGGVIVWVNAGKTVVRLAVNLIGVAAIGYLGIAVSNSIGFIAQFLVLAWLAHRQLGGLIDPADRTSWIGGLIAGTAALIAAGGVRIGFGDAPGALQIGAGAIVAAAVFVLVGWGTGVPEIRGFRRGNR